MTATSPFFSIPYYHQFLSPGLARELLGRSRPIAANSPMKIVGDRGGLESIEALRFLSQLYETVSPQLARVLALRTQDRQFIDQRVRACHEFNQALHRNFLNKDYRTVIGLEDTQGRIVFGPKSAAYCQPGGDLIAPLPDFLKGVHVTLFGPPDSAKLAINAMNSYHRRLPGEPPVVAELLAMRGSTPIWGADDEDSKTPLHADLVDAGVNLTACFEGSLSLTEGQKTYQLASTHRALPIKRIPGLALPSTFLFQNDDPIPLHLYDFALHLYRNRTNPQALVFYVPKLENEEEAQYLHFVIATAEEMLKSLDASYVAGTVRLMIVLENPRAILRTHEIMTALFPYFAGASLGWHDYLASTARLFKEDSNYRIPVKADPNIVIKYIKASHRLVAEVVGSRGGITVGGMYGILPLADHPESFQICLRGFFRDVITQLKRDLSGFWVAHPDFVRIGLALTQAWKLHTQGDSTRLRALIQGLLSPKHAQSVLDFVNTPDVEEIEKNQAGYVRSLIVADLAESDTIANNHPDEIRYNVFQSLQYLADWLAGNGCVALPTLIDNVPVRVMDDLATAERSRREVWHEIRHGRFTPEALIQIAHEELNFIRRDLSDGKKIVQVKWSERTARWYPVALRLMLQLMTAPNPPEFATELLLPFAADFIRNAKDPWAELHRIDPEKYALPRRIGDYEHFFEICGSHRFASLMADQAVEDREAARRIILSFSKEEVVCAGNFHGDIGQTQSTLDARAAEEQSHAAQAQEQIKQELRTLGKTYRERFGFKFLVSAKGKSAQEMLALLRARLENDEPTELQNAREALWEITAKRLATCPRETEARLARIRAKYGIAGLSIALNYENKTQEIVLGDAERSKDFNRPVTPKTYFQLASLSKTLACAFAVEYFKGKKIPLSTSVNELLAQTSSSYRIPAATPTEPSSATSQGNPPESSWADQVTLADLMSHSALNMHYVNGFRPHQAMPKCGELLQGHPDPVYPRIEVIAKPGTRFQYSGGGYLLLEHLIESLEGQPVKKLVRPFLDRLGLTQLTLDPHAPESAPDFACGYFDSGEGVPGGYYRFPAFAAGGWGTAGDMARFLRLLTEANRPQSLGAGDASAGVTPPPSLLAHETAVEMLLGSDKGCLAFMGCKMGLGIFTAEAGPNRLAIHQGANEGFRALFIQCTDGPDRGKGLVIFANGDQKAVLMIAEIARELLSVLDIAGIDFQKLTSAFDLASVPSEQAVNLGYKRLIFDAFEEDLPEPIAKRGALDPLSQYNLAVDATILGVSNQKFARAENLISPFLPTFDPDLFGRQGKVMDSWESARHNPMPCDWLELKLKSPARFRYISLSTQFHDGNQAQFVRILSRSSEADPWEEQLPKTAMDGHSLRRIDLGPPSTASESPGRTRVHSMVRVEMFPDGGLSRLGLFDQLPPELAAPFEPLEKSTCVRFSVAIPKSRKPLTIPYLPTAVETAANRQAVGKASILIDVANLAFGGEIVHATNEHYGPARQVISPFPPLHMFDGLESARSRKPGHHEEVRIRLAGPTPLTGILLDFTYFINNNPKQVSIHGLRSGQWLELVKKTDVKAYAGNTRYFSAAEFEKHADGSEQLAIEEILVRTYPDGGINRIRVIGPVA